MIVGQAPSASTIGGKVFSGRSGKTLARMAGLEDDDQLRDRFECINLLHWFPGKNGKGDAWDKEAGLSSAHELIMSGRLVQRNVVLLGKNVAEAFRFKKDPFKWYLSGDITCFAWIYHTSGIVRQYNDTANVVKAGRILMEALENDPRVEY